ncbi:hypothetical protein OOK58_59050 [Streptomyces sp. NBC_01728]|uniref:hypothetical protein n=1 Tax=unclassified Streptomyces TaxID=2593676 RepID=UPI0022598AE0|nr:MULTISPECIES: hypothetical protein [unclassified Streptomyces]MCX4462408.1 hypothetical protein [Streptomyces sp. NBC_01719]MCX4500838.1 hypothetical protein [Streptomyces sp. NBC_01728]
MPRKKSAVYAANAFKEETRRVLDFVENAEAVPLGDQDLTWVYELALVKTAVAFERLMLACIVCAVNNDTSTISEQTGINFPKHLTDEVCEYLVTGGGYFDFKGRDGLIKTFRKFLPTTHYLPAAVKLPQFRAPLEQLIALRNFAAHESPASKAAVLKVLDLKRISSAGAWVKKQGRLHQLASELHDLADEIIKSAPY